MEAPTDSAGQPKYGLRSEFDGLRVAISAAPVASDRQVVYTKRHALHVLEVESDQQGSPKATALDGIILDSPEHVPEVESDQQGSPKATALDGIIIDSPEHVPEVESDQQGSPKATALDRIIIDSPKHVPEVESDQQEPPKATALEGVIIDSPKRCFFFQVSPRATAFDGIIIDSPASTSMSEEFSSTMRELVYDVFINHYGEDVKHTFASDIYKSFKNHGLRVFLDKNELELGDFFPAALEEAMRNASIYIAIFSENYAHSPWCLAELEFMLRTRTRRIRFIPIFYHVEPATLRWAIEGKGSYASAFYKHESRYNSKKTERWKWALHNASLYTGEIISNPGDEGKALANVVNCVLEGLKDEQSGVADYPVRFNEADRDPHKIALKLLIWVILRFYFGYGTILFLCFISWLFVMAFIYLLWWPSPRNWIRRLSHRLLWLLYKL